MGASSKDKRTPPSRKFEEYVLTYETVRGTGLYPIDSKAMSYVKGPVFIGYSDAGAPGIDDGDAYVDIGFSFQIDGKKYTRLYVSTNGWCCLTDPSGFAIADVLSTAAYDNTGIKSLFTKNHVLLAVWFDDLRNVYRTLDDTGIVGVGVNPQNYYLYAHLLSTTGAAPSLAVQNSLRERMRSGLETKLLGVDESHGGVKFYRGNSNHGRFLLIRWKSFSDYTKPLNFGTFDLMLYENGTIEYRYDARKLTKPFSSAYAPAESSTVGVFAYGGTLSIPRYRDFGYLLKKDTSNSRGTYEFGGAVYNGTFLDSGFKYTISLKMTDHWPGLSEFGAIFRFSPPQNRRKQNRSISNLRDSTDFTRSTIDSYFDDQKTVPNSVVGKTQMIEYPSMLPVSSKLTSLGDPTSLKDLHQSGSIQVSRSNIKPGLYDSILLDSILDGRRRSGT